MQVEGGINDKVRQFQCKLPMSIPIRVPSTLSRQLNVYMRAQRWPGPDFSLTAKLTTTDLTHLCGSGTPAYSCSNQTAVKNSVSTFSVLF